jgi:HSP20 family protein
MATRREQNSETTKRSQSERGGASGSSSSGTSSATEEQRQSGGSGTRNEGAAMQGGGTGRGFEEANARESQRSIPTTGEGTQQQRGELSSREQARGRSRQTGMSRAGFIRGGLPMTPWALMRHMSDELDRLVDSIGSTRATGQSQALQSPTRGAVATGGNGSGVAPTVWVPQIEVEQRPGELVVRADLPGLKPDDVQVSVDDGLLTIQGERREVHREEQEGLVRSEVVYGGFYRAVPLPEGADETRIAATFRDGVLEITIPVSGRERGRRIAVQP